MTIEDYFVIEDEISLAIIPATKTDVIIITYNHECGTVSSWGFNWAGKRLLI